MQFFFSVFAPLISNSSEKSIVNIMELANTDSKESGYFYPKVAKPAIREKINLEASISSKLWEESMII